MDDIRAPNTILVWDDTVKQITGDIVRLDKVNEVLECRRLHLPYISA
jgi:hypothetical protein